MQLLEISETGYADQHTQWLGSTVETATYEPISIAVGTDSEHLDEGLMRNRILRT